MKIGLIYTWSPIYMIHVRRVKNNSFYAHAYNFVCEQPWHASNYNDEKILNNSTIYAIKPAICLPDVKKITNSYTVLSFMLATLLSPSATTSYQMPFSFT